MISVVLLFALSTAVSGTCTVTTPGYVATATINVADSPAVKVSKIVCASGYKGVVYPWEYTCSGSTFTPPLDGCGRCLLYHQPGYQLADGDDSSKTQYSYNYLEPAFGMSTGTEYECEVASSYSYGLPPLGTIRFPPVCRENAETHEGYWDGALEGCVPKCRDPTAISGLGLGIHFTPNMGTFTAQVQGHMYVHDETAGATHTLTCGHGWDSNDVTGMKFTFNCSQDVDFEWSVFAAGVPHQLCTYPAAYSDAMGRPKEGNAPCEAFVPPPGFVITATMLTRNFDVAHGFVYDAYDFVCGDPTVFARGTARCENREWIVSLQGCEAGTCPAYTQSYHKLLPEEYAATGLAGAMMGSFPVTGCSAEAAAIDGVPLTGRIECVAGAWVVKQKPAGCAFSSCPAAALARDYPGYSLSIMGGDVLRNNELLNETTTATISLTCAANYIPSTTIAMTTLSEILCTAGRFVIRNPTRKMQGCDPIVPSVGPPVIPSWCDPLKIGNVPPGYIVVKSTSGVYTGLVCADGYTGTPVGPTCTAGVIVDPTLPMPRFSGCSPVRCDGEFVVCSGGCRAPPGRACRTISATTLCCEPEGVPTVTRAIIRPEAALPADVTKYKGFGSSILRISDTRFAILNAAVPKGTAGTDYSSSTIHFFELHPTTGAARRWKAVKDTLGNLVDTVTAIGMMGTVTSQFSVMHSMAWHKGKLIVPVLTLPTTCGATFYVLSEATAPASVTVTVGSCMGPTASYTGTSVVADDRMIVFTGVTTLFSNVHLATVWLDGTTWKSSTLASSIPSGSFTSDPPPLAVRFPFVFVGDKTEMRSSAVVGNVHTFEVVTEGPLIYTFVGTSTPILPASLPFDAPSGRNYHFGASIAVAGDMLVVGAPAATLCTAGVLDGGYLRGFAPARLFLGPETGTEMCTDHGAVFVFRYDPQRRSWGALEAVLSLPPEVDATNPVKLGAYVATTGMNGGTILASAELLSSGGVQPAGAASSVSGGRAVLVYRRRQRESLRPGVASESVWYAANVVGLDDVSGNNVLPAERPQANFAKTFATLDGTQILLGHTTLSVALPPSPGPSPPPSPPPRPDTGIIYHDRVVIPVVSPPPAPPAPDHGGAVLMYSPMVQADVCGPVPNSLLVGVAHPGVSEGQKIKCASGSPTGTVCEGAESGYVCDAAGGFCGTPMGLLNCDGHEWLGKLQCVPCKCERPPTIAVSDMEFITYSGNCSNVPYRGSCAIKCTNYMCGAASPTAVICDTVTVTAGVAVASYSVAPTKGGCRACQGAVCKNSLIVPDLNYEVAAPLGYTERDYAPTVVLPCNRANGKCGTSGTTFNCISDGSWMRAPTTCSACAGCTSSSPGLSGVSSDLYELASPTVGLGDAVGFTCKECAIGDELVGGAVRCVYDAGNMAPKFSVSLTDASVVPRHCRKCYQCRGSALLDAFPQYIFADSLNSANIVEAGLPYPSRTTVAGSAFKARPITTACRPPYTSPLPSGPMDFECVDGLWVAPSGPFTSCISMT